MKAFSEFISEAVRHGINRCTAVTVNAIAKHHGTEGVNGDHNISSGAGVVSHFKKTGLKVSGNGWEHEGKTVKQFVNDHPTGTHYIATRGHAMALVNGKLHDTTNKGANGRKIELSFEIKK